MKKVTGILVFICVLMLPCLGFGARNKIEIGQDDHSGTVTLVGQIGVYGNEPNTWLGLVDQKGVGYVITGTVETLVRLRNMQGIILEVTGKLGSTLEGPLIGFQNLSGGILYVQKFKPHILES